jgi:hypothetical protein
MNGMERIKVVVRYNDGKVLKGYTQDFFLADKPSEEGIEIFLRDLKALFLVRDFSGNPKYKERKKYVEGENPSGRKLEITFCDGEVMVGTTLGYDSNRPGFFIFPADPQSNNVRVFVISSAVKKVRQLG